MPDALTHAHTIPRIDAYLTRWIASAQPVYVLEQVTAATEGGPIPASVEARRHLRSAAPAVDGDTPTMVLMVVLELKTEDPSPDTFDVPVYCKCAASA